MCISLQKINCEAVRNFFVKNKSIGHSRQKTELHFLLGL